jgi:transcriptional regulator with XRE-family HTH domain
MEKESHDARAGTLLRRERRRSAASQAEVAARAGVPQSTISAYESGARQPTLPMLSKLLEAMGAELVTTTQPLPERLVALRGPTGLRIRRHRHLIAEAAARYDVQNVRVRGPVTEGAEQVTDPVEVLVEPQAGTTVMGLLNLEIDLQELIGVPVRIIRTEGLSRAQRVANERAVAL